jgi:hypothetical protein
MPSLSELVARAQTIAEGRGTDPHQSPIIDDGMTAEALVPHAIRYVLERAAADDISSCFQEFDLTDGDDLPEEILREHLDVGYLEGVPHSSYIPPQDYRRSRFDSLLKYWTVSASEFLYSGVGTVTLKTPAMPETGGDPNVPIDMPERLIEDAILVVAGLLTGEIALQTVLAAEAANT